MQDKRHLITLSIIALAVVLTLPQTIPAVRFVSFGLTTGDWLNDWGLINHGYVAGLFGFGADVLTGRVGVDYPWEDTLPGWIADTVYHITGLLKEMS